MNNKAESFGCHDGNCVYFRPLGMHTNTSCKCINATELRNTFTDRGFMEFHSKIMKICINVSEMRDYIKWLEGELNPSSNHVAH